MQYKRITMLAILLAGLLALSAVNAADVGDDIVGIENQDNEVICEADDVSTSDMGDVLNENPKTFTDLNTAINGNNDSDVYLNCDYAFDLTTDSGNMGGISINRDVTVHGNGHKIDAGGFTKIFTGGDYSILFKDIIFANAKDTGNRGAAVLFASAVNCTFINNSAMHGGAIAYGSAVNCTFISNYATMMGGAMYRGSAANCTFINNSAGEYGGAIYEEEIDIANCAFINNSAGEYGGAVYASYGSGHVINCTFANNHAYSGGAFYLSPFDDDINVVNCNFTNNSAQYAGALYVPERGFDYVVNVLNCNFIANTAKNYGGAVEMLCDGSTLSNCSFVDCSVNTNSDCAYGGAVCWQADEGIVGDCSFVNCSAVSSRGSYGGGIYFKGKNCSLVGSYFENNFADNGSDWYSVYPIKNETSSVETVLSASDVIISYGDSAVMPIALTDDDGSALTGEQIMVILNDESYYVETFEGQALFSIPTNLVPNSYIVFVYYGGSDIYRPSNTSAQVTVNKMDTILTSGEVNATYKDGSKITAALKDINGNAISGVNVKITAGSLAKTLKTNSNGQVSLDISSLTPSSYAVEIKSATTDLYNRAIGASNIVVNKADMILDVPDVTINYSTGGNIVATLKDIYGDAVSGVNVKITVGSLAKTLRTGADGRVVLDIGTLAPGIYDVAVKTATTDVYNRATAAASAIVSENKIDTVLTVPDVISIDKTGAKVVATFKDIYGNVISGVNVKITVGSLAKTLKSDANGQVALDIGSLAPGIYDVAVKTATTDVYNRATATATAILSDGKIDTVLDVPNVACVNGSGSIVAAFKDIYGNVISGVNVKITVGSLAKTLKTDADGKVALDIGSLAPGIYDVAVKTATTDVYNRATATAVALVCADKIDTVLSADDVVTTQGSGDKLVATLKDAVGNAIQGLNVKITVGSLAKTLKTNADGQVALDVSTLDAGSYTATIKSASSDIYNWASQIKAKVTVNES